MAAEAPLPESSVHYKRPDLHLVPSPPDRPTAPLPLHSPDRFPSPRRPEIPKLPLAGGTVVKKEHRIDTGRRIADIPGSEIILMSWNERADCNTPQEQAPICPLLEKAGDVYICKGEKKVGEPYGAVVCPLIPSE